MLLRALDLIRNSSFQTSRRGSLRGIYFVIEYLVACPDPLKIRLDSFLEPLRFSIKRTK
jgi:hypothetical protein